MTELDPTMTAQAEEARQAALDDRAKTPPAGETPEEYYARVQSVPGVFGDYNHRALQPEIAVEHVIPVDVPELTSAVVPEAPADSPKVEGPAEEPDKEPPAKAAAKKTK